MQHSTTYRARLSFTILTIIGAAVSVPGHSQTSAAAISAPTPEALVKLVQQRFATGSQDEFNAVDPDPASRGVVARAIHEKAVRKPDLGKVVFSDANRAVLLLTGTVVNENSAVETIHSRHFSGFYEAVRSPSGWSISRQLPFDDGNHILSHSIRATITPGSRIDAEDTLTFTANPQNGFAVRINDQTQIHQVKLNGRIAPYLFGGGVFWIKSPLNSKGKLLLRYSLAESRSTPPPKGQAAHAPSVVPEFGSFLNETFWAPLFDVDSANGTCPISITLRIPAAYYATTSVPQTEKVKDGIRIVKGHTSEPEFILSLIYDRGWHPTVARTGNFQFGTFLTPDFRWTPQVMEKQVSDVDEMLTTRFGPPQSNYLAVAEERDIGPGGFRFRTNDLVVSAQGGGKRLMSSAADAANNPQAPLAHEVSHGWTMQASGPAANFLREGWATYCEWMFVGKTYGPSVEKAIWQTAYNYYFLGGHNGVRSILGNPDNGSIHYLKGAWILHMLEASMGRDAFDEGMRKYIQIPRDHAAGYPEFIAAMSKAAGHDMTSFIMPWLSGKYIPDLETKISDTKVIVTQEQPDVTFDLPLTLQLTTASGSTIDRPIHIAGRVTTIDIGNLGSIRSVRIDPNHEFLLQRHLGENVRFTLSASAAKTVALAGGFALKPVPAMHKGAVWTVEMSMVNGRYNWEWIIDGKKPNNGAQLEGQPLTGVSEVQPLQEMPATAYPKQK